MLQRPSVAELVEHDRVRFPCYGHLESGQLEVKRQWWRVKILGWNEACLQARQCTRGSGAELVPLLVSGGIHQVKKVPECLSATLQSNDVH